MTKDYRSLETKIRSVLEATATEVRRKVVNVARSINAATKPHSQRMIARAAVKAAGLVVQIVRL